MLNAFMSLIGKCSDGLGVTVEASLPRGQWFESPLEQFVLKTRAINSILRNRNIIRKITTWWEKSDRGNRKTVGKNSAMVGYFPFGPRSVQGPLPPTGPSNAFPPMKSIMHRAIRISGQ